MGRTDQVTADHRRRTDDGFANDADQASGSPPLLVPQGAWLVGLEAWIHQESLRSDWTGDFHMACALALAGRA